MGYRNIKIDSNAVLCIKNAQLLIGDFSVPLEDINCLLIENENVKLSSYLIQKCADYGIPIYCCNEKHLPNCVLVPFEKNSRHLSILRLQIDASKPLNKRIWQSIIKRKIKNQACCLKWNNLDEYEQLEKMGDSVQSGDKSYVEAKAAAYYFRVLFGSGYSRREETVVNAAMNYAYAIVRGVIARTLVIHGLEPSLGINHCSVQNNFNLVDDFLEPFRPMVDMVIMENIESIRSAESLTSEHKRTLLSVLTLDMLIDGRKEIINNCIDIMVESYIRSLRKGEMVLLTPQIIGVSRHNYE